MSKVWLMAQTDLEKTPMNLTSLLDETIDKLPEIEGAKRHSGKVRESYSFGNGVRGIVVTDRISAFDFIMGTVPLKGQVLNRITTWWLQEVEKLGIPTHLISTPHPNVSLNKEAKALPVEFVMRGYVTGTTTTSSWYAYNNYDRMICGIEMPKGMKKNEKLPSNILTPSTKPDVGHDVNLSKQDILDQGLLTPEILNRAEEIAITMFEHGQKIADTLGLILVDTKYEMGLDENGDVIVIDEVHTPDSSRYWIKETYEECMAKGEEPNSLDKEFVRRMVVDAGYDVDDPSQNPKDFMTVDIRLAAAEKYIELLKIYTGETPDTESQSMDQITQALESARKL